MPICMQVTAKKIV